MSHSIKDHYQVLGLSKTASQKDIEHSFHRLSNLYYPDKNPDDRITTQRKFNNVCEAFYILSNPISRTSYDELRQKPSLDTALGLFLRFFDEHGFEDDSQRNEIDKLYPQREQTYYQILGIHRNATPQQIERAFRKLSIKYHPKNNLNDSLAQKKFIQVCKAYNQLKDNFRRNVYDDYKFGQITPLNSHKHFVSFFKNNPFLNEQDTSFFRTILKENSKNLASNSEVHDYYQTQKINSYQKKTSSGQIESNKITQKSYLKDGKRVIQKFEQVLNKDSSRNINETINDGGIVSTKTYTLKQGQNLPISN